MYDYDHFFNHTILKTGVQLNFGKNTFHFENCDVYFTY